MRGPLLLHVRGNSAKPHRLYGLLVVVLALAMLLALLWAGSSLVAAQAVATTRASAASDGTQGNNHSRYPSISADGRQVAFYSVADNLVPGDTNGSDDVFVHEWDPDLLPTPTPTPAPFHRVYLPLILQTPADGVTIEALATDRVWLRATIDDIVVSPFEGEMLEAHDSRTWAGQRTVTLRVGNAGAIEITCNGIPQGQLGPWGAIAERTWTPSCEAY